MCKTLSNNVTATNSQTQRRNWSDLAASLSNFNTNSQLLCQLNAGWGGEWKLKLAFSTSLLICGASLHKASQWLAGNVFLLLWFATGAWIACLAQLLWHHPAPPLSFTVAFMISHQMYVMLVGCCFNRRTTADFFFSLIWIQPQYFFFFYFFFILFFFSWPA